VEPQKRCPDCAETVLAAARVCKHCGYEFFPAGQYQPPPPAPPPSPYGAPPTHPPGPPAGAYGAPPTPYGTPPPAYGAPPSDQRRLLLLAAAAAVAILGAFVWISASNSGDGRSDSTACATDLDTIKTAIAAWTTQYASGDPNDIFDTKYPTSMSDLTDSNGGPLERSSALYDVSGDGSTYPTISSRGDCPAP
jgi:hypothetical protein